MVLVLQIRFTSQSSAAAPLANSPFVHAGLIHHLNRDPSAIFLLTKSHRRRSHNQRSGLSSANGASVLPCVLEAFGAFVQQRRRGRSQWRREEDGEKRGGGGSWRRGGIFLLPQSSSAGFLIRAPAWACCQGRARVAPARSRAHDRKHMFTKKEGKERQRLSLEKVIFVGCFSRSPLQRGVAALFMWL